MVLGQLYIKKKKELQLIPYTINKNELKIDSRPRCKTKLLGENRWDLGLGKDFLVRHKNYYASKKNNL